MKHTFSVTLAQRDVMLSTAAIICLAAGRRWGKTTVAAMWLAQKAIQNPSSTCWYVSLSYARVLKQMRIMARSKAFMKRVRRVYAQFPPRIELLNGAEICFRSLDRPDNLLGDGLVALVVDEASRIPKIIIEQTLLPMLADTDGRMLATSTYNGRDWFYEWTQEGLSGENKDIAGFEFPTSSGLRFEGEKGRRRLARLRERFTEDVWQQEFECKPMAMSDAVFGSWVDTVVIDKVPEFEPDAPTCISLDIGKVVDPSVCMVAQIDGQDRATLTRVQDFPLGMAHDEIATRCAEIVGQYTYPCVVIDATGGGTGGREEEVIRFYRKRLPGIRPVVWTATNKPKMIGAAKLAIERQRFLIPKTFTKTIEQFKVYRYKRSELSMWVSYGAPAGQHDEHVSAGLQIVKAHSEGWIPAGAGALPVSAIL